MARVMALKFHPDGQTAGLISETRIGIAVELLGQVMLVVLDLSLQLVGCLYAVVRAI